MPRELRFSINGGFVTQLAREKLYQSHDLAGALELVLGCTVTDDMSYAERFTQAIDILEGRKDLVGTYPEPDYGVAEREPDVSKTPGIAALLKSLSDRVTELQSELRRQNEKFTFVVQDMSPWEISRMNRQWHEDMYDPGDDSESAPGPWLFPDHESAREDPATIWSDGSLSFGSSAPSTGSALLDDYLKAAHANKGDDYGWLSPTGVFTPVDWGDHQEWAREYMKSHPAEMGIETGPGLDLRREINLITNPGDRLTDHGWILLHSPHQGIASPTMQPGRRATKAQREFLYGYYIDRDLPDKAAQWLED